MKWIVAIFFELPTPHHEDFMFTEPTEIDAEIHAEELCRNLGGTHFQLEWMF